MRLAIRCFIVMYLHFLGEIDALSNPLFYGDVFTFLKLIKEG